MNIKIIDESAFQIYEFEKESKRSKISFENFVEIYIDSEYNENGLICLQIFIPELNLKLFVININLYKKYPKNSSMIDTYKKSINQAHHGVVVLYRDLDNEMGTPLHTILTEYYKNKNLTMPRHFRVYVYWAIKDLIACFGRANMHDAMTRGKGLNRYLSRLFRLRNLKGSICLNKHVYSIYDLYGLAAGSKDLKSFAKSFCVEMNEKGELDKYKEDMIVPFVSEDYTTRETFFLYAMRDATSLSEIFEKMLNYINAILVDCFSFPDELLFDKYSFPSTIGKLVYVCFMNFVTYKACQQVCKERFILAMFKLGILKQSHKNHDKNIIERIDTLAEQTSELIELHCVKSKYAVTGFSLASSAFFMSQNLNTSAYKCSAVTGARTLSCRYREFEFNNVLDIDISSCYGSVLKTLTYPIGRPSYYFIGANEPRMSLKDFLEKNEKDFVPGLWQITVTGELDFSQDLIYSKIHSNDYSTGLEFVNNTTHNEIDNIHLEHALLRREIFDGIITDRLLELIRKISSQKELKGFYNLKVQAAVFWKKSNRVNSIREWVEIVLDQETSWETEIWTGIPISDFSGVLTEERSKQKSIAKLFKNSLNPLEKIKGETAQGIQELLKILVNSLYGVIASKWFDLNNVVLANQITASARAELFLISKSLNLISNICDGGLYTPEAVFYLKTDSKNKKLFKPSFNTLADSYILKKHPLIYQKPLFPNDWTNYIKSGPIDYPMLDNATTNHCNTYWKPYNLCLNFGLEHKPQHTSSKAVHWAKAHYAVSLHGQYAFKIRGQSERNTGKEYPLFQIFRNGINNNFDIPNDLSYTVREPITIAHWKQAKNRDINYPHDPGDFVLSDTRYLRFNYSHFPFFTRDDFLKYNRKIKRAKYISFHEKFKIGNIKRMISEMLQKSKNV